MPALKHKPIYTSSHSRMMAAPAAPIRKKRNFKALALDVNQPPPPPPPQVQAAPAPTRPAPAGGKKRPPPMKLTPKPAINPPAVEADNNLLTVGAPNSAPPTGTASAHRSTYHTTLSTTLANLDLNSEKKSYDLRNEDLRDMNELGQGNGGSVKKVEHVPTGTIMAKKVGAANLRIPVVNQIPSVALSKRSRPRLSCVCNPNLSVKICT